uniref:Uncharacterized protein n=1 Tax=Anguilla anguilla TaxID=7936 RepID=A0A0E9ULI6_ANGAN
MVQSSPYSDMDTDMDHHSSHQETSQTAAWLLTARQSERLHILMLYIHTYIHT